MAVKKKKKISTVQHGCKHDNMMNKGRRQSSTGQEKKKRFVNSNYFYTEESISCTNFCALVTLFACTLHIITT